MRQTKQESGVTMVALVVTIVLMLIIAGILVATFSGNSGLVTKASDSQIYTELSQLRDTLNQYKTQGEAQRIKDGDYSGEMSNDDLEDRNVLNDKNISYDNGKVKETVTARNGKNYDISSKLGIINIMKIKMSPESKLSNADTIKKAKEISNPNSLTSFNNVFILDEETDNLYYVRDNTVWTLDEESEIKDNIQIADGTIQITGNPGNDTWTNKDVIVSIKYANNLKSKNYTDENGKRKSTTENEVTVTVSESKTKILAQGQVDGKIVNESYTVSNIDKTAPTITYDKVEDKMLDEEGNATLEVKNITVSDALSGVKSKKYGWSSSATVEPTGDEWIDLDSNEVSKIVNELGDWYLWVIATDNATNESQEIIKCSITEGIAKVVETGITYSSVQEAIEACTKDGASYTIQLLKDTEEISSTYKGQNITLDLCGHTINNNEENTPTIENNAILNIINSTEDEEGIGRISSTNSVAIKNNENATLTLGTNDDTVSTTNPEIIGKVNGILNNGTFNFYDGIIKANKAISGTVTNTPTDYSAITTLDGEKEVATLGILADYAAKIDTVYFSTLPQAVEAAKDNDTIELLIPVQLTESLTIDSSKNITIDLHGNNISTAASSDYMIKNYGNLKLISTIEEDESVTALILSSVDSVIYNDTNANLSINNINVKGEKAGTSKEYKNVIENLGNLNLENGTHIQPTGNYNNGIHNTGVLKNDGAVIEKRAGGGANSIYNDGDFENISGALESDLINESGKVTVTGGEIYSITNQSNEELIIQGGIIKGGNYAALVNNATEGKIKMTGGTVYAIKCNGSNNVTIDIFGGNIKNTSKDNAIQISNNGISNLNIAGGIIEEINISINTSGTNFNMTGGTANKIESYAKSGKCNITLGENDGTISTNQPEILSGGITTNGAILNFYDGKITGNPAVTDEITQIPDDAELNYETSSNKETITLKKSEGAVAKIEKDGLDVTFNKIQDAIDEYNGEEGGIILLRDYNSQETITINETKNIILNLNGKNIVSSRDNFITNNGTLEIIDSTNQGAISSKAGTIIDNNKDLIISSGTLNLDLIGSSSLYNIGLLNKGNLTINGGTIKSTKNYTTVIKNESTGTAELLTGTIQVPNYSDCNGIENLGLAQIKGGNIKSTSTSTTNYGTGIKNSGELNIIDGEFAKLAIGIDNISGGIVNINGGTIQATKGIQNNDAEVNFNKGNITAETGIYGEKLGGTINVNGGIIEASGSGIQTAALSTTTIINMTGGEINSKATGINLNNSKGNIKISGGTITATNSSSHGINIYAQSTSQLQDVQIIGGKINAAYGIYISSYNNKIYNQTITIGEKGGSVSKAIPEITGTTRGVYNSIGATLNFYDGIIKGASAIEGTVTTWEENYEIIKTVENDIESAYLDCDLAVAKVGEQTYSTLEEAFFACTDNQETTVELLRTVDTNIQKEIGENKNIILDLKGNIITFSNETGIVNNGTLKIIDSVGEGILRNTSGVIIENNKELIINSGTLSFDLIGTSTSYEIGLLNKGNLTINGGILKSTKNYTTVIKNESTGTVELLTGTIQMGYSKYSSSDDNYANGIENLGLVQIRGGNIISDSTTTNNYQTGIKNSGELNITDGEFAKLAIGIDNISGGIANINGGTIQATKGIQNNDGEVNLTNGSIIASTGINGESGTINVNGGIIETTGNGIQTSTGATIIINMTGGEINSKATGISLYNCNGNLKMSGGSINTNRNSDTYGINVYSSNTNYIQNVEITGGTINAKKTSTSSNNKAYGIYMQVFGQGDYNKQTLTIGTQGDVITTTPDISGDTYGVYNESGAIFNFYDGIIKGSSSIVGKITKIEENYDVIKEKQDDIESAYLGNNIAVAKVGDNQYYTLEEAFLSCADNQETTVEILRDISIDSLKNSKEVTSNQDIILDIKGNTVEFSNETGIINNGKLKIIDSLGNGILRNTSGTMIENNKDLIINSGTLSIEAVGSKTTYINGLVNNANLTIEGGTIQTTKSYVNIMKNTATGKLSIQNGTIQSTVNIENYNDSYIIKGIENSGILEITGGTIINPHIAINNLEGGKTTQNGGTIEIKSQNGQKSGRGIQNNNGEICIKDGTKIDVNTGIYDISTTNGTINIEGGEIEASTGISLTNIANLNIVGGKLTATSYGINISGSGSSVTMAEGIINSSGTNAVYIASNANFKMTGGSINTNSTSNTYGINVYSSNTNYIQNIEITGGTINSKTTSTSSSAKAYGIYMHTYNQGNYKQTLTIGTQGNGISTTTPSISGDTYGVYNESGAVFNFYDGIIKGKTLAMSGKVTKIENKYTIVGGTEEEYQTASLGLLATDTVTAFVNGTYYDTLQAAINSCADNEKTYVIMSNGTVLDSDITIGENQDIVLDLNGYTVSGSASIINNGTLTIIDTSEGKTGSLTVNISGSGTVTTEN